MCLQFTQITLFFVIHLTKTLAYDWLKRGLHNLQSTSICL